MKRLNDRGEFRQTLALFDQRKDRQGTTERVLVQVLKACSELTNLNYGEAIHQQLSSSLQKSSYIQSSLINFYSELFVIE
jgi:hypothetical protein